MRDPLDDLLAEAANLKAQPSADLMARVMADAARMQPVPQGLARANPDRGQRPAANSGILATLAAVFGGRGVLAGMATAALAGVYLGAMQPAVFPGLSSLSTQDSSYDTVELIPGLDTLLVGEQP